MKKIWKRELHYLVKIFVLIKEVEFISSTNKLRRRNLRSLGHPKYSEFRIFACHLNFRQIFKIDICRLSSAVRDTDSSALRIVDDITTAPLSGSYRWNVKSLKCVRLTGIDTHRRKREERIVPQVLGNFSPHQRLFINDLQHAPKPLNLYHELRLLRSPASIIRHQYTQIRIQTEQQRVPAIVCAWLTRRTCL